MDLNNLLEIEAKKYNILHEYGYYGRHTNRRDWFNVESKDSFILKVLDIISKSNNVLDIGCGKGSFMHHFNKVLGVTNIDGIDISQVALDNADPNLRLTLGSCSDMPYEDNSYDVTYHFDGMEHIPLEIEESTISEQFRVSNKYIIHSICTSPDEHHDGIVNSSDLSDAHINLKTPDEWRKVFTKYCDLHNAKIIEFSTAFDEHVNIIIEKNK